MIDSITQYNGLTIAGSGILVVFTGLVMIALVIQLFNKLFARSAALSTETPVTTAPARKLKPRGKPIPEEHQAVIAVALAVYHKLYHEELTSEVTFADTEQRSGWKTGYKFGQRIHVSR
ncbi:OadG family protein [bacterium]|nr:OadG family protein [bacterium]